MAVPSGENVVTTVSLVLVFCGLLTYLRGGDCGGTESVVYRRASDTTERTLIWAQPFFVPHVSYLDSNLEPLQALLDYGRAHQRTVVRVYACGYAYSDELFHQYLNRWRNISETASSEQLKLQFHPQIYRLDRNYGQAASWNVVLERHADGISDYDGVVLTGADSFLMPSHLDVLKEAAMALEDHPYVGVISFNLEEYHLASHDWPRETYVVHRYPYREMRLLYSDERGGVAGSISVYSRAAMRAIQYRIPAASVYCPDDGASHAILRDAGLRVVIAHNLFIGHAPAIPKDSKSAPYLRRFKEWKDRSLKYGQDHPFLSADKETMTRFAEQSEVIFHDWNANSHSSS